MNQETFLTTAELAARWRITPRALALRRKRGAAPASIGSGRGVKMLWPLSEVLAWEAAR